MKNQTILSAEEKAVIAGLGLFIGTETALLNGLIDSARLSCPAKNEIFLMHNQPITRFYVVLQGWCAISKTNADGQESILQIAGQGDFLPEPELTRRDISPFNLQALTAMKLLMLPPNIVRNAMEHSPAFMKNMLAASVKRNQQLRDHIECLTLRNAEERVGRFLLQMRLDSDNDQTLSIDLPFDKNFIASFLGVKPETFSRSLQLFRDRGFIINRNNVTAPNFQALCDFCDSTAADQCHHAATAECPNPTFNDKAQA